MQLVQVVAEIKERSRLLRISIVCRTWEEPKDFIKAENTRKKERKSFRKARKETVMLMYLTP